MSIPRIDVDAVADYEQSHTRSVATNTVCTQTYVATADVAVQTDAIQGHDFISFASVSGGPYGKLFNVPVKEMNIPVETTRHKVEFTKSGVAVFHRADTKESAISVEPTDDRGEPDTHPIFESKYWHVEKASDSFNEIDSPAGRKLGKGSFGTVFYGVLHTETGQRLDVAIKRFHDHRGVNTELVALRKKQFGTEMMFLTRYVHVNIIKLIGFSSDGPRLCLIYEYMPRGTLSSRLDCKDNSPPLGWSVRLTVARDIGAALKYLHTTYRQPVIHRDVKTSNVLLGTMYDAKLCDFGLAIISNQDTERDGAGAIVGTSCYMSPETLAGHPSTKTDVYAFGVVLLELCTGLPPYSSKKKQSLKQYIEDMRRSVHMVKMLDPKARWPRLPPSGSDMMDTALLATTNDVAKRPEIPEILVSLSSLSSLIGRSS